MPTNRWRAKILVERRRVVLERIRKEESSVRREIVEPLRARLQELERGKKPRVSIIEVVLAPQTRRFERWFDTSRQFLRRKTHDVLLIEPLQFFRIEHGVAAADSVERKRSDELVAGEHFLIPARRPPEQRKEIEHRFGQDPLPRILDHGR